MAMTTGSAGRGSPEINVTPLIDVLLVLLIIFMLIIPPKGETADIPQPSTEHSDPVPEKTIVVQIQDKGSGKPPALRINEQDVSWEELEPRLRDIYASRTDKVAFLKGDPEIDFQYAVEVVDLSHHAGVAQVGLLSANE